MNPSSPCAWSGTAAAFLQTPTSELINVLTYHHRETGSPQLFAWRNSLEALHDALNDCLPEVADCGLILEYELPRSGGRRPDLIFLNDGIVLVIEFKNRVVSESSDLDQVLGYARDLGEYHAGCREKQLRPVLIPLGFAGPTREEQGVTIVSPRDLTGYIKDLARHAPTTRPDPEQWIESPYEPMPALVEAARLLFERRPLPRIRRAEAANIPARVARMEGLIQAAIQGSLRRLILVSGVPGSGKTLIGLQTAYSRNLGAQAVMLSGNGPLVSVLQYVLDSKEFVQPLKNYLRDTLIKQRKDLWNPVIVFDEAQRAWDRDRVLAKHQGDLNESEPSLLLSLANSSDGGFAVVALLGEGQEIHAGEESGIQNWVDAVRNQPGWSVIGPHHLGAEFIAAGIPYQTEELFHLDVSLRSRKAGQLAAWVEQLLSANLERARELAAELVSIGYPIRMSRNLANLKKLYPGTI